MEEAMRGLDQAMANADAVIADIPDTALSQEQIDQIEEQVRAGKAPEEIKALQERIDAGDLTWDDLANGRNLDDETVQQAFAAGIPKMQRAKELIDEGHSVDDIIGADPNRPNATSYNDDEPPDTFLH